MTKHDANAIKILDFIRGDDARAGFNLGAEIARAVGLASSQRSPHLQILEREGYLSGVPRSLGPDYHYGSDPDSRTSELVPKATTGEARVVRSSAYAPADVELPGRDRDEAIPDVRAPEASHTPSRRGTR